MCKPIVIKFKNNETGVYMSGQTMEGCVELVLKKPTKVISIGLRILGIVHASWKETETTGQGEYAQSERVKYKGKEDVICNESFLLGTKDNDESVEMATGTHTYNFQCLLPMNLPTTFEGSHGYIRYTVEATLDQPWKFYRIAKAVFTVISHMDLNCAIPRLRLPSQIEIIKKLCQCVCICPCQSTPLVLIAHIPMTGYVPEQTIHILGELNNNTNVIVSAIHFKLRKIIGYIAEKPSKSMKYEIVDVVEESTTNFAAVGRTQLNQALVIPAVPPTNLTHSKVIHQTYEIIVEARLSGSDRIPTITIPITIGTVPFSNQPGPAATGLEYPSSAARPQSWNDDTKLPLPSVENCGVEGPITAENQNEYHSSVSPNKSTSQCNQNDYGWSLN